METIINDIKAMYGEGKVLSREKVEAIENALEGIDDPPSVIQRILNEPDFCSRIVVRYGELLDEEGYGRKKVRRSPPS